MPKPQPIADLEEQLIPGGVPQEEANPYFSLEAPSSYFSLADVAETKEKVIKSTLTGKDALAFLGLPTDRALNHLQRGDFRRVSNKFKALFQYWSNRKETDGIDYDKQMDFWKQIKIRVYNKANLAKLTPTEIVGKKTAPCHSIGVEGGEYTGDLYDGRSFSTFLSEVKASERWREVFVVLESVNITEDMKAHA